MDVDKVITEAVRQGIAEGVKAKITATYSNPFEKLIADTVTAQSDSFRKLLSDALASAMGDAEFREQVKVAVRHTLAKTLVARFGGELEKQVNVLKSDPTTRARITLAIEEIVKEKVATA